MKPDIKREILEQAQAGNIQAFAEIYQTMRRYVYNTAYRIIGHPQEAEEVTQEVFLKVHRNLEKFRYESSFSTWIYRISVHTTISMLRRGGSFGRKHVPMADNIPDEQAALTEWEQKKTQEQNELTVQQLLSGLSPKLRACIVLREIEGLSYEEIAEVLQLNINTVRTRIKRARWKMLELSKGPLIHEMS